MKEGKWDQAEATSSKPSLENKAFCGEKPSLKATELKVSLILVGCVYYNDFANDDFFRIMDQSLSRLF